VAKFWVKANIIVECPDSRADEVEDSLYRFINHASELGTKGYKEIEILGFNFSKIDKWHDTLD
jgi:hypothetical protein